MHLHLCIKRIVLTIIAFSMLWVTSLLAATPEEKVSLQLDWKFQFEFAGFIMAKEKGFYKEVGLDVELREYQDNTDIIQSVLSHKTNYGLNNTSVAIHQGKIKPIILMATYFQQSPLVFVTSKEIKLPSDLIGKTIMGTQHELKYSSLALMLKHFYINDKNATFKDHTFDIEDFIQHKVDAMTAFETNELFELEKRNIEYNIINPVNYGFATTAVNLFTSPEEVLHHPERTRKFITATNKGWEYALANTDEAISIIYNNYSKKKSIEALKFEAEQSKKIMLLDFFKIGETNKELSLRIVKQLKFSGILSQEENLGKFIFDEIVQQKKNESSFSTEQNVFLQNKKVINMCIDPDWMPFESLKNQQHIGITADIIKSFEQKIPIPIRVVQTNSWAESIQKAKNRECDIYSLAAWTPERSSYMDFTSPYIDLPIVMATKTDALFINDINQVKHKKIGVVKDYAIAEQLRASIPGINIVDVTTLSEGLERVESGELFGYIDNLMVIANAIQKNFTGELKVTSRLKDNVHLAIGTRNDQPILNDIFEILITGIKEGELQSIYNKWVAVQQEPQFDYSLAWKLLIALFLLASGYFYHYKKLKTINSKLLSVSITDALTGLYNRLKIDQYLIQKKADFDRYESPSSIILLDIDYFKHINDDFGHQVGDKVLIEFSNILKENIRETDLLGRWGGEEFLIICPNTQKNEALVLAKKLLREVRNHSFSKVGNLTFSAGVSAFNNDDSINETISHADKALYQSKRNGRNQASL